MENARTGKDTAEELFSKFMEATDCPEITNTFRRLVQVLRIHSDGPREFYNLLKDKLQSWKCKSLWELLDCRANQKEYGKGKICEDTHVLVIGAGPIGLRTAIEVALLGAHVVIVEKRESFTRNNVLHLWPFLLTDFRSLGAKKFYGKFCSGSIDHISIRRLQSILLKTALILGAKLYTGVTFEHVIEPNSQDECWKCKVSPESHPVSEYEFDVLIAADGKKNVLPGFQQIEMRGTLAIGITANFVNHGTEAEANVEEISGIAYQFNPQFFDDLYKRKGIKLENIVYYKDETHYFVMTAGKASLLKRGALKQDLTPSARLLAPDNVDHSKLLEYVTDVVKYATKGTLNHLELKLLANNQPDIAAFDFTSIKKAEHAARIVERKGSKLLVGLVGDSLLEPFWPTGSGCARGVLSALDAAWMIRSFAQEKPPLQILSERENIYRLLSGTNSENLHKTFANYTVNPSTRYLHITNKRIREVYHLYDTDDPVNADFSIGSPQTAVSKASRKRRISTGAKHSAARGHRRGRASSHLAVEHGRIRSTSGSSAETLDTHKPLAATKSEPLDRKGRVHTLGSVGSDDEVFKTKTRRGKSKPFASPLTGRRGRSSTVGSSGDELKEKRKKTGRKRTISKEDLESPKEKTQRKRGFFGFGRGKQKRKAEEESDRHLDKQSKSMKWKRGESIEQLEDNARNRVALTGVQKREGSSLRSGEKRDTFVREDSWARLKPAGSFSREQYTRRSAREIIREMEARAKGENLSNAVSGGEAVQQLPKSRTVGDIRTGLGREAKGVEEERDIKNKPIKKQDGKPMMNKEHEKKKNKNEERKMKEEEKRKKEEEKKRHEVEKKNREEHEKRKKKEEEQKKKGHSQRLHNDKESAATPPNKRTKKQRLLDEIAAISPSAKRAMPVLSLLSPALDKNTEGIAEHTVTSTVRDAAMILLATPLLIDSLTSTARIDRKGSWLLRDSGRVRDVVKRYDTLSDMKPVETSANGCVTPHRRPKDRIDGVPEKPRRLEGMVVQIEESKMDATRTDVNELNPGTEVRKSLVLKQGNDGLSTSTSLQRLKAKLQDINNGNTQTLQDVEVTVMSATMEKQDGAVCNESVPAVSSVDSETAGQEATGGNVTSQRQHVAQDFNSPIWQKTAIAVVTEKSRENKENEHDVVDSSVRKGKNKDKQLLKVNSTQNRRRSSVLPFATMEEKLENLLNSTTTERAMESIKYMISVFRQIQKHPNEERHYRIFKGRVKFRKHVGTIRNARLFMESSGWAEIGSFFILPLSKQIEAPLLILNKYLSILEEKKKNANTAEVGNQPRLQRAGSSDLAERIMELKDALVSARITANKNRARKGSADETRHQLITFKRTISLDEMSTSRRRTSNLAFFTVDDTKRKNSLERVENGLDKGTKGEARNLRRSASESTLNKSPKICSDPSSNFTPFIRTFSGRSVKEDAGDYDLVMETPLGVATVSENDNRGSQSTGIHGDENSTDHLKLTSQRDEKRAQVVRSPAELVQEEADELSNLLGDLMESLGSLESTDNEEESEGDKVRKTQEVGREGKATVQDKDEELVSLCETLNHLINEDTSDSSESSLDRESKLRRKKPGSSKEVGSRSGAFKPPLRSTKKTTQRMKKAKSVDKNPASSQRGLRANSVGSQERVAKSSNLNATAANSKSSIGRSRSSQQREVVPRKSISGSDSKSSLGQRTGPVMRAHRQNASQILETSRVTRNKELTTNKLDSTTKKNDRKTSRAVSKAKSVDLARVKERLPATKSRSVELPFKSDEANRRKSSTRSQMGRRSASVSSSDENMKTQKMKNTQRTTRPQPARQSLSQGRNRLSSGVKFGNRRGKPAAVKKKKDKQLSSSDTDSKSAKSTQSLYVPEEEHASAASNENCVSLADRAESTVCNGSAESEQTLQDKSLAERNVEIQSSHSETMKGSNTDFAVKLEEKCVNRAVMQPSKENDGNIRKDSSREAGLSAENGTAVVELSKEIQSYYGTDSAQLDGGTVRETDVKGESEESSKVDCWFPSDSEFRQLVQQTKKDTAASDEENTGDQVAHTSVHETDSGYGENIEDPATEPCRPPSVKFERSDPKVKNKKMLLDIGRQHSIDRSRKDVVSLTLDERKQQILDAAVAKPKSKPTDKRRSILQIKSRSDGKLVKSTKEAFEKQPSNQAASKNTGSKSSKQQLYDNRDRKKKSVKSANSTLAAVTEDQEEPQKEPIRNGPVTLDQSHYSVARNTGSTGRLKESSMEQSNESSVKGKRHSPVKLSPFWLRLTKRRGSYDFDHTSVGNTQESPQHFTSNELE